MSNPASVTNISKAKFKTSKTVMSQASEDATPFYIPVVAYDTDADQQKLQLLQFNSDDLSDSGTELSIVPFVFDVDQSQLMSPIWNIDVEDDKEGVPYIIIPVQAYDTDAFQQLQWPEWIKDYEDLDLYQYISFYVMSIYKIGVDTTVECVIEVDPTVTIYDVTASPTCTGSVQAIPSVHIYAIACKPTVTCVVTVTA